MDSPVTTCRDIECPPINSNQGTQDLLDDEEVMWLEGNCGGAEDAAATGACKPVCFLNREAPNQLLEDDAGLVCVDDFTKSKNDGDIQNWRYQRSSGVISECLSLTSETDCNKKSLGAQNNVVSWSIGA